MITEFKSHLIADVGISMGDEGKGRLVYEIIDELKAETGRPDIAAIVLKVNGGANSGHTAGGLKLNLLPAGVIEKDVKILAIGSGVVADPRKFLWEGKPLEARGYNIFDRLLIHAIFVSEKIIETMINFAAIDFETANGKRTSVCSVGVVIVREGKITNKIYRLIRPRPNYYTQWTTAVHGLTYDDTMEADEFPEVWAEIKPLIDGLPLVAHNSPFDEGCLRAVHELYDMTYPDYKFYCTCRTSRKVFGKDLPNHQLHTVAERCGYHLENHHHALADAEACAQIALLIIPEPKKARKTKKADKDIHVGDLFASLIPQPVKKSK